MVTSIVMMRRAVQLRPASSLAVVLRVAKAQRRCLSATIHRAEEPEDSVEPNWARRDEYKVSRTVTGPGACAEVGLSALKITKPTTVYRNLTYDELFDHEVKNKEGVVAKAEYGRTFAVDTGKFTGRSPKDKYAVRHAGSESAEEVWWGPVNQPMAPAVFDDLMDKAAAYMDSLDAVYVGDVYSGASAGSRIRVRFVHELAWQQHFVTNMFIRPREADELAAFEDGANVDMTVINACAIVDKDHEAHGLNSEVAVAFDFERKLGVILGTWYGGENKKGIFALMNYLLPLQKKMPMHCSANVGDAGDVALFFGLSGTGKTTLSASSDRSLIGDDEHGWDDDGIFNFEGGCYAKTINLAEESEPEIYRAIRRDALLENIAFDAQGRPDYADTSKTQNGRVSYPIYHVPRVHEAQRAGHPKNVIFLTCDAFGVLPPVSRLDPGRAMYHFLSGYTAKVAGTERGVKEPTATFSACFGEAFLTLHPTRYADLLKHKLDTHGSKVYLVNTGWAGGGYGVGARMPIAVTRRCVEAILDGSIDDATFVQDPIFGFEVPTTLGGVDASILQPRAAWADPAAYDAALRRLAQMYVLNFERYEGVGSVDYTAFGPNVAMTSEERNDIRRLVKAVK